MDALLLDFNGVVVNDEPLHFASFRDVLAEEGLTLDEEAYYADYLGLDDHASFREAFRRAGRPLEPRTARRLIGRKAERYAALAARDLPIVPGVGPFLRRATGRCRVAIASGALRREIVFGLTRAGVVDLVEVIVSAEDVGVSKPDPACHRLALARLAGGAGTPARAVVVEDSLPGLYAARALGAGCVMLTTSHAKDALAGADRVWDSFEGHDPAELGDMFRRVEVAPDV